MVLERVRVIRQRSNGKGASLGRTLKPQTEVRLELVLLFLFR